MSESETEECSYCSEYGSKYYCFTCHKGHCDRCLKETNPRISHRLEHLSIPCANHVSVDNLCKHFCELCDKPVCPNCILKHIGQKHSLIRLQDAIGKKRSIVEHQKRILCSEEEERQRELEGISKNENVSCDDFFNAVEAEMLKKVEESISKMRQKINRHLVNSPEKIEKRKKQLSSAIQELKTEKKMLDEYTCSDILAFTDDNWRTTCYSKNVASFAIIDDLVQNNILETKAEIEDSIGRIFQEMYNKFFPERLCKEIQALKIMQPKEINIEVEFLMDIVCASKSAMICSAQNKSSLFRIENDTKSVLPCIGFNPEYLAMSPSSGVFIFTSLNELFKVSLKKMEPAEFFKFDSSWEFNGLTFSANDLVYVCLTDRSLGKGTIMCLNMHGCVVDEFFKNNNGHALFVNPIYITENKNNDCDICVSDNYSVVCSIKRNKEIRFVYKGENNIGMDLRGIDCDGFGNVIVSDSKNNCLHIINKRGKLIRMIGQGSLCKPTGICVDLLGRVWVTEYESGRVKVIDKHV